MLLRSQSWQNKAQCLFMFFLLTPDFVHEQLYFLPAGLGLGEVDMLGRLLGQVPIPGSLISLLV